MEYLKFNEGGKWQDKPYEPQFEVSAEDEIDVGSGTIIEDGKAVQISHGLADVMLDAKRCSKHKRKAKKPAKADKAKSEKNPALLDKQNAESE